MPLADRDHQYNDLKLGLVLRWKEGMTAGGGGRVPLLECQPFRLKDARSPAGQQFMSSGDVAEAL